MTSDPISSAAPASSYDEDAPEHPRLKAMRRLVTLLLVVLIAGFLSVVIALLLKLKEADFSGKGARPAAQTAIPGLRPGERLLEAAAAEGRILLTLEADDGSRRVVVLDGRDFRPLQALEDGGADR